MSRRRDGGPGGDGGGRGGAGRPAAGAGRALATTAVLGAALAASGCDDLMKWVPIFSTMTEQPSVETYEEQPRAPVEGTIPVDGEHLYSVAEGTGVVETLTLQEADTLSPPAGRRPNPAAGQTRYRQFCLPCHGPQGGGDGTVVGPNRIPAVPALDLTAGTAPGRSDGYIFGMITVGRGLMPSYRRIPAPERWDVVAYVRALQSGEGGGADTSAGAAGGADTSAAAPEGEGAGADTTGGGR